MSRFHARRTSYKNIRPSVCHLHDTPGGDHADISSERAYEVGEPHFLTSRTLYCFCQEDFIFIFILVSFNLALTVLPDLRFCLLSIRIRSLILLANGITEALLQLFLSCLETVYARVLCVAWSAKQQD